MRPGVLLKTRPRVLICLVLVASCATRIKVPYPAGTSVPHGADPVIFPADNAFTQERWALGRKLFFDPVLSIDSTLSCSSCHKPGLAFADSVAFSPGVMGRPGTRNAPSLANVAYHPYFLREGGVPTLEMQILVPIQEHNEFAHNIVDIARVLARDSLYVTMSKAAYDRTPDPFVITRSLATFERTILSGTSAYDRYIQGDGSAIDAAGKRGSKLFFSSRLGCTNCHSGHNFSNYAFENNALDTTDGDAGRMRATKAPSDKYLFKVPSLRNVEFTAPYMHDGRYATLEQVVSHYNAGGQSNGYPNPKITSLMLTDQEQAELVAFLRTLSDPAFLANPAWQY